MARCDACEQVDGKIYARAIRVMLQGEYRITIQDNQQVWCVFFMLSSLSVGVPLILWQVIRDRNVKIKVK